MLRPVSAPHRPFLLNGAPHSSECIFQHLPPPFNFNHCGALLALALEATLLAWERDPSGGEVPAARLCRRSAEDLATEAHQLAEAIDRVGILGLRAEVVAAESTPGGGSSALLRLPSSAVALSSSRLGEEKLASALRCGDPAVLTRIDQGRVLLDVRTLLDGDFERVLGAVQRLS